MSYDNMTKEEIKNVTSKVKEPCLVGMRGFDEDIQQYTCRCFNFDYCECYKLYRKALDNFTLQSKEQEY